MSAEICAVDSRLETPLDNDVAAAREALGHILGEMRVDAHGGGFYAQMDVGPVLLAAVRADVASFGCGGAPWSNF
jgi:hypothetical protein